MATTWTLIRHRPRVVCAQNPSLALTLYLLAVQPLFRFRFATDVHYGGVVAVNGSRMLQRVLDMANRRADLVIVTNVGHARRIEDIGGHAFVCPDPLPEIPGTGHPESACESVLFVCSFDPDEPWQQALESAQLLAARGFRVFLSGNCRKVGLEPGEQGSATLLGYVDRSTYYDHLRSAAVVVDLTTFENCLVCGAYEAMAAGKPCVLSATAALREFFTHGTVFTTHEPETIAAAVIEAHAKRRHLESQVGEWKVANLARMEGRIGALRAALGLTSPGGVLGS